MSQVRFEQYKDALRRGHVAARGGHLAAAVTAYEAAVALAPDRALPYTSLAEILRRLGRPDDAEATYGLALQKAPADEAALAGRAALREAAGRRREAADDLESLARTLADAGRPVEACDAGCHALELAESRSRRHLVGVLVARLPDPAKDPAAAAALARADRLGAANGGSSGDEASTAGLEAVDGLATAVEPAPVPVIDPLALFRDAEAMLDADDYEGARTALLQVAATHRERGELDAALDACLPLMARTPGDPAVQLEIAANQVARGWTEVAALKIRLLRRLVELDGDAAGAAVVEAFSSRMGSFAGDLPAPVEAAPVG
jgi:tetratricopeptide (TPR) repeat protein